MGLMINYHRTEYMKLSNSRTRETYIIINNHNIEEIMEFKYLRSLISNNTSINHSQNNIGEQMLLWSRKSVTIKISTRKYEVKNI
jgi:hypothetical protein